MNLIRSLFCVILPALIVLLPGILCAADFSGSWTGHYYGDWSSTIHDIDITINQSAGLIQATSSYTVSGLTGNFSGTVEGESLSVRFSHTNSGCLVSGTATATLRDGVLVFDADGSDCNGNRGRVRGAAVRAGSASYGEANWMNIDKKRYPSGIIKATIWASVDDPARQIKSVAIVTPTGAKIDNFVFNDSETPTYWEMYYKIPLAHLEAVWPDGIYVYDILLNDESHAYAFAMLYGEFPGQFPNLTSHQNEDYLDPAVENTLEWDAWDSDAGAAGTIYLGIGGSYYAPKSATSLVIPAGALAADRMEDFDMNFHFNTSYRAGKNMTTDYYLRTGNHVVSDLWVMKAKVMTPAGDQVGAVVAGLEGVDIKTVLLQKPDGSPAFSLAREGEADGEWHGNIVEGISSFETSYPDGSYTLVVTYSDNTMENKSVTVGGVYPSAFPEISAPLVDTVVTWDRDFRVSWTDWTDFARDDTMVIASISPADKALTELKTSAVWSTSEGIRADGVLVPPGVLPAGKEYALSVLFVQGPGDGGWKASGRMRVFRSSASEREAFPWNMFLPAIYSAH